MTLKWIPANYGFEVLIWQSIYEEVMAKAKELGSEDPSVEVEIRYEGVVPGGPNEGKEAVGVSCNHQELGRTGERFFY